MTERGDEAGSGRGPADYGCTPIEVVGGLQAADEPYFGTPRYLSSQSSVSLMMRAKGNTWPPS